VIPVKNDRGRLQRCLAAILANRYPSDAFEIVVADNGSTDGSCDVARAMGARVISLPGLRVSEVRNRAVATCRSDVIALVDADHEIEPTWIAAAVETLAENGVGAAGALYTPPPDGTWVQCMYGALRGRTIGRSEVGWLGSGNLAVKREAFEAIGGFDSALESCEDVDFCQRLRAAGWRILGDERLASVHLGDPETLRKLFTAERWRGRDNLRVSLRGPLTPRNLPSIMTPVVVAAACLALVGSVLAGPVSATGAPAIAAAASVVLGLSALRTIRMATSSGLASPGAIGQAFAVALTYDLARAAALVTRASHHREHPRRSPSNVVAS
jgi:GT2 family glycosyltransferase